MTDRELLQMALDAIEAALSDDQPYISRSKETVEALRSRLAQPESAECDGGQCGIGGYCKQCPKTQPENEFAPDWNAMAVMVEEQQRMAKRIEKLEAALAQPEPEPLEYWNAVEGWVKIEEVRQHFDTAGCGTIYKTSGEGRVPLYAAREWQGLTDEETNEIAREWQETPDGLGDLCRAIEAKLKEKNG